MGPSRRRASLPVRLRYHAADHRGWGKIGPAHGPVLHFECTRSIFHSLPGGVMIRAHQILGVILSLAAPIAAAAEGTPATTPAAPAIEKGSTVQLEYTLKDDAGAVLDSNKGQSPFTYTQGEAQLMPGLEKQLDGMHVGEEKTLVFELKVLGVEPPKGAEPKSTN